MHPHVDITYVHTYTQDACHAVCVYSYIHTYRCRKHGMQVIKIHTYTHTHTHIPTGGMSCLYSIIHTYTHTYTHTHTYPQGACHAGIQTYINTHIHTHIPTGGRSCRYSNIHTYTHTHTYTHREHVMPRRTCIWRRRVRRATERRRFEIL